MIIIINISVLPLYFNQKLHLIECHYFTMIILDFPYSFPVVFRPPFPSNDFLRLFINLWWLLFHQWCTCKHFVDFMNFSDYFIQLKGVYWWKFPSALPIFFRIFLPLYPHLRWNKSLAISKRDIWLKTNR